MAKEKTPVDDSNAPTSAHLEEATTTPEQTENRLETSDLNETQTESICCYVATDNIWCNNKHYKAGDDFDAELTEAHLNTLLKNGVVIKVEG